MSRLIVVMAANQDREPVASTLVRSELKVKRDRDQSFVQKLKRHKFSTQSLS